MLGSSIYPAAYGSTEVSSAVETAERPTGWWALGLMRILIGVLWWTQLLWKKPRDFGSPGGCPTSLRARGLTGLCDWLHREALHPMRPTFFGHTFTINAYADFVKNTVIPHFNTFGWIAVGIETFITASLVLGLFGRLGGLVGTLWALNLLVGLWSVPGAWYWTYVMLAALNLIFFATCAGRYLGLDGFLTRAEGRLGSFFRFLG